MIQVSISEQKLFLYRDGQQVAGYIISTAANGIGFDEGSYCTPVGNFEVAEMIGGDEALGTIFKARKPVGVWMGESSDHDLVLTRIIRLQGLDPQNANTMERYIYIHGTNQEHRLGEPASCGCIRMNNADMIDLFDRVKVGEAVSIA